MKPDKVIVTNLTVLQAKYGSSGVRRINRALTDLIRRDKKRGLNTRVVAIDSASGMKGLSAPPVTHPVDPRENKAAIDAVYKSFTPDYLLILGSIDVIPHQDLKNPMFAPRGEDRDQFAYGDIPYACEAPYSPRPEDFVGPTRVVGRLPDLTGGTDARYIIGLIRTAAAYKQITAKDFGDYFAISAQIWKASTQLSVTNVFGTDRALGNVPPRNSHWNSNLMRKRAHFFNCHGASRSHRFYGQPASGRSFYPVALDGAYVDGKIKEATVAAAECCYGGELYAVSALQKNHGICNTYLGNKCYGFFASTTIAYGPEAGNAQADLLCQFFLQGVMAGASLGRAATEARQRFVRAASPLNPSDLKTLAQFNLYGDPGITPVEAAHAAPLPKSGQTAAKTLASRVDRRDRRRLLFRQGLSLAATEPAPKRRSAPASKSVVATMRAKAREVGIVPGATISFTIQHPKMMKQMAVQLHSRDTVPTAFHVLFGRQRSGVKAVTSKAKLSATQAGVVDIVALIGKEAGGKVVSFTKIYSR
jgi:hypothetical protein